MKYARTFALISAAAATFASTLLVGCETVDESAPTPPRPFLNVDDKAAERAKQREEEKKGKELPPAGGPEFPGQSNADPFAPTVITADDLGTAPASATAPATSAEPTTPAAPLVSATAPTPPLPAAPAAPTVYTFGTLPHLNTLPKDHYAEGSVSIPGIDYPADFYLGQVLPLPEAQHRDWPTTAITVKVAVSNHNPTYFTLLADRHPNLALFTTPDNGYGSQTSVGAVNVAPLITAPVGNVPGINCKSLTRFITKTGNYINSGLAMPPLGGLGTAGLNKAGLNTSSFPALGSAAAGFGSDLGESAWFMLQTVALPAEMIVQHPLSHVQSFVPLDDPNFHGYLPETGLIAPTAYPGVITWRYPWTRDINSTQPATMNANSPTTTPDMEPKEHP